ncbi:2-keto-4-pentenoate hydratase/2-oxohepta-3-ene-1,7-dioic acid hydratase in catechol pathway [Parvibaculum indicum]|uniref:fumarylacetoacetate hydrolase family protein n=1 Tax=Parvibaculum indicum TaxID=562969 RepID=UPI0014204552|nr:fumarylacetoacetate hydrolase family protein [Parvibaculum indicum]NIJ42387.1 2-keto-4-pentenoate hydratase/2-oxohepta-3-ene-1,7-dioic acid hydratase in catechol pathway [Parvibaculum indicum]
MRFVTYAGEKGAQRPGLLLEDGATVADLGHLYPSLLALIDAGEDGLAAARKEAQAPAKPLPLAGLRLLAPLPEPRQLRDCMVYEKHLKQASEQGQKLTGAENPKANIPPVWYAQPIYYKGNRFSVIGTETDIEWPAYAELLDFELELALVIGRKGKDIAPEKAGDHIFGYMIFNDVSARDAQMAEMQGQLGPAKGKDFDTGNVFGPWLVTADEVGDIRDLHVRAAVNGETVADTTASDMQHEVGKILAHMSASETLYPGEVIGLGTIGDCCLLEHGRFLAPGDTIEFEVEKLGTLRNRLVRH